ncbi:hypothetical protein GCM10018987_30850 [Streptomyces cremeus]
MLGLRGAPRVRGQSAMKGGEHGARRAVARRVDSWLGGGLLLGQLSPSVGYEVPAGVTSDPELCRRASSLAAYGLVVVVAGGCPFEKIKHL